LSLIAVIPQIRMLGFLLQVCDLGFFSRQVKDAP
jgi:hypothetical protein